MESPPLLIVTPGYLSPEAIANLRHAFDAAFRGDAPPKLAVLEGGMKVFQLVEGRWAPLDPSDQSEVPVGASSSSIVLGLLTRTKAPESQTPHEITRNPH